MSRTVFFGILQNFWEPRMFRGTWHVRIQGINMSCLGVAIVLVLEDMHDKGAPPAASGFRRGSRKESQLLPALTLGFLAMPQWIPPAYTQVLWSSRS